MTVVQERQVKTIADEVRERFIFLDDNLVNIEDMVRLVIAQYDISGIEQDYIHDDILPA